MKSQLRADNNGYGYNGKLKFIKVADSGLCADGISANEIEITVRLNQDPFPDAAFMERENCSQISPKVLKLGEEAVLSKDLQTLTYQNQILVRDPNPALPVVVANQHLYVSPNGNDANPGTPSLPFLTIQKATDMALPGTTVHVAPGVYAEQVTAKSSGTENARIQIVSDAKGAAKIRPVNATTDLWLTKGDYVDLIGFEFDGTDSPTVRRGIGLNGNHTSAQSNLVHHVALATPCDSDGAAGIYAYGGAWGQIDEHIIGNTVHHVGTRNCQWQWAISHGGTGSMTNNVVSNANGGLSIWHDTHHVLISNNTVFNTEVGLLVGAGDPYLGPALADYVTVMNNIIAYVTKLAVQEDPATTGSHNLFANNLVFANQTDWSLSPGQANIAPLSADPLFVSYLADGSGNYRLQQNSPAIDSGRQSEAPGLDADGASRRSGIPDLGAFEWHP